MKWLAIFLSLLLATPAFAQSAATPIKSASPTQGAPATSMTPAPDDRAKQWLSLLDDKNYDDAYNQLSQSSRNRNALGAWQNRMVQNRESLGAMASRTIKDVKLTKVRPGMSDGQAATVRYDSSFAKKVGVVETVTLVSEKGAWSVSDYTIQ